MPETKKSGSQTGVTNYLGWALGGLSLLNLLEDLTPLKLLGKLERWMVAYAAAVDRVGDFLFGWMQFRWMNISSDENHMLVLALVPIAAYVRAQAKFSRDTEGQSHFDAIGFSFTAGLGCYSFVFLPALLLPAIAGLVVGLLTLSAICIGYFWRDAGEHYLGRAAILHELFGVMGVCVLLVALNYTVFT